MLLRADPRCFAVLLLLLCNRGDSVLVDELEAVAALWPNQELGDFEVLEQSGATCTVAAVDVDLQAANVQRVVDAGIATGATVLVLPELSTSADIPLMLRDRLEQFDDKVRLIVAGSYHHPAGEAWANTSLGVLSDAPDYLRHDKLVPVEVRTGDAPRKEAIEAFASPLTIYAVAGVRLAIVICRDYLDTSIGELLDAVGVNLILVPAMSERTDGFATNADGHIAAGQALSFIVNGPLEWNGRVVAPAAILGQPITGSTVLEANPSAPAPSVEMITLVVQSLTSR